MFEDYYWYKQWQEQIKEGTRLYLKFEETIGSNNPLLNFLDEAEMVFEDIKDNYEQDKNSWTYIKIGKELLQERFPRKTLYHERYDI